MEKMIIDITSDLHGSYPKLRGGDLLIIAGDLTGRDEEAQYFDFVEWLIEQNYKKKVVIGGNHDMLLYEQELVFMPNNDYTFLQDSGTEFEGLKIWGTPWTNWFSGVNPDCTAFMLKTDSQLQEKFDLIPPETDILISHSPPRDILDKTINIHRVGSQALRDNVLRNKYPLHVFGHIHESYGTCQSENVKWEPTMYINASHMNIHYEGVNDPVRVIYEDGKYSLEKKR